jgi:hexosaminidase
MVKKLFLFSIPLLFSCHVAKVQKKFPVIPLPSETSLSNGYFTISQNTSIVDEKNLFQNEINYFNEFLSSHYGFALTQISGTLPSGIIALKSKENAAATDESYSIKIDTSGIEITGTEAGIFYAIQTLKQTVQSNRGLKIPGGLIKDSPEYKWRGMHLDVCRHFFSVKEVKKYIDLLSLYKLNTFHWHLTDDQGWRIEVKEYPLLTSVGSKRKETLVGNPRPDAKFDGIPYGGFYTQEEIKEVVQYAAERHITVVPEIEMPGHSLAAVAAYPQLSCRQQPVEVGTTWGVFDDVYCPGNDSTFFILENILDEVCELFPGKYIHIGGDECQKERWKTCAKCQARIKAEGLKDEHELQSYFIRRIEKYLNDKGRQIIGWDEILEGGLAPNAAVMSWRGTTGGIEAAKQNHYVVMSPGKPCYFDHYQSKNKEQEPIAIGGYNPLKAVYNYEPTPEELTSEQKQFILGAQGNVWTEYISTFSHLEYMSVPRMAALSETLWTSKPNKKYSRFIKRLKVQSRLLDKMKVNYAKHFLK